MSEMSFKSDNWDLPNSKKNKYNFIEVHVTKYPTGFDFSWSARNFGWGHLTLAFRDGKLRVDTECMSQDFVEALLVAAAPQLAALMMQIEEANKDDL